jgi:HK97 gp10 family phage protein
MTYQSNLNQVLRNMDAARHTALTAIGEFVRSEAQVRSPVKTGALRDSNDYQVQPDHVIVGNSMSYSVHIHEGTSRIRPNPFLEDAVFQNQRQIKEIAEQQYRRLEGR